MEPNQTQSKNGALIGSIIIIVILVLGGIYLLRNKVNQAKQQDQMQQGTENDAANNLSNSDDVDSIDADLDANSNVDGLDKDLE